MNTENQQDPLEQIPANRRLVEALYAHGKISREARQYALHLLYPHYQWGLWISRLLLIIGTTLVLAGIVYFFAFNWARITPAIKLAVIQSGMIICLLAACYCSLERMSGQVWLLCASVLVGVFMAVFGQIYQTGVDAYQLFMMWSLLTLGWTLIARFAAQWMFWLLISNIFLVLWWQQAALPAEEMKFMIFPCLTLLNGTALALREYLAVNPAYTWLTPRWIRVVLIIATLVIMLIPIVVWILEPSQATQSIIVSSIIGLAGYGAVYYVYRYRLPDMWVLATSVLSGCIVLEIAAGKILSQAIPSSSVLFLLAGLITLGIFTRATTHLIKTARQLEGDHV